MPEASILQNVLMQIFRQAIKVELDSVVHEAAHCKLNTSRGTHMSYSLS